jgi:PAS domain S-box-containing protein
VRNLQDEFIFWNKAAETLYGWRKDEVIGKTTHAVLQTIFPEPIEQIYAEMARSAYWEGELAHHRRDGTTIVVSSRWAMSSGQDEPAKILESNRDITKRKEEEGKFRSLLEAAPDAVVIINDAGLIVLVNSQTERMFGYMRSEMLNQEVELLLPDKFREKHLGHRAGFYSHPKVRTMGAGLELYARRKDGSEIPVEISLSPLETQGGILVSASIRDISERKRAMETIRQNEEKLRLLIQGVNDYAILMLDSEGRINTWNEGAERIKGYRAEEILGTHFSIFYTADDVAADKPSRELIIAEQNGRFEEEGWRVRKDGTRFWASVIITALRDEIGQLRGFGKVTRDISERKKAEEDTDLQRKELAQKNAQLLVANNELESFSYSVSHDLRTPLRAIDGFSHALMEDYADKLDDEGKRHLQRIRTATQRMGNLIDDLLGLARLSRASLHLQLLDVSSLVNSIASDLRKAQPERQIELQITEGLKATADAGLLRVVLENLLGNAWKFTSKKPVARIEFGQKKCRGVSTFFLQDDGAGFDPEYAGRLFGAFQRLHGLSEFEGTGIGLATVRRIIQRHNGHIWADGMVDRGATFYFTLDGHSPQGTQI